MFADCNAENSFYSVWASNSSSVDSAQVMFSMFASAPNFNQDIGNWDVSNVITMAGMFASATAFNNGGSSSINNWDTSSVTNMRHMFELSSFNQPIGDWDVSNVTDMFQMFRDTNAFNQYIGDWDTSNVTFMAEIFRSATAFDQDIGGWDVSNLNPFSFRNMFDFATAFNNGGSPSINNWNTSNATDMEQMFRGAESFNQSIVSWDVSNVTNMSEMFREATAFNQNLSPWITGLTAQPANFSLDANATFADNANNLKPFLANGTTRITT